MNNAMPRYFIAIPLPDDARNRLVAVQPPVLRGMRILARDELHLTLHFLGELPVHDLEAVRTAVQTVNVQPFAVTIQGVGMFPSERHAKVLWAGVAVNSDLTEFHRAIGAVLTDAIGFRPEDRPYSPHITLARLDEPAPPEVIDRYLDENQGFEIARVPIDRFILYSSRFEDRVPKYQEEAVFSLVPASAEANLLLTLDDDEFVAYLGPAAIHDGIIKSIQHHNSDLEVTIQGADGTVISIYFANVTAVQENRAEGMMLYALAEFRRRDGRRLFIFSNWETDGEAKLAVVAEEVRFQVSPERNP